MHPPTVIEVSMTTGQDHAAPTSMSIYPTPPHKQARRILIADDDEALQRMLADYLTQEGYQVRTAVDGKQALEVVSQFAPDLVLLDVKMPEIDGLEVARRLHAKSNVPIIMLSALGEDIDRVAGLSAGSDDYVTKPVRPRELLLRIQGLLRRVEAHEAANQPLEGDLHYDDLVIRPRLHVVERNGVPIDLSANEFELLYFLASHPRQVFTRQQLLDQVWHYEYFGDTSTVTVHMSRLRKKVELDPSNPRHLRTVWRVGYKFVP
jgi:two-component system response regulator VicR